MLYLVKQKKEKAMDSKKGKIIGVIIILFCVVVIGMIVIENFGGNNPVKGTYKEQYLKITLSNNSFEYYNGISNTTTTGDYEYTLSEDGKKATVRLIHNSSACSYDGAIVYFFDGETWLVPTINGSEVIARRMVKIS